MMFVIKYGPSYLTRDLAVSTKEIVDAQSMHDLLDLCRINHRQITTFGTNSLG